MSEHEHLPQLSVWPVVLALGVTLILAGVISSWIVSLVGVALLLFSIWSWTQENRILSLDNEADAEEVQHE
jgi:hypothetical protein